MKPDDERGLPPSPEMPHAMMIGYRIGVIDKTLVLQTRLFGSDNLEVEPEESRWDVALDLTIARQLAKDLRNAADFLDPGTSKQ